MIYQSYILATFFRREKRFTAYCRLPDGREITAHVRNTGRCADLLIPGNQVVLEYTPSPTRKNDYTLYMVNRSGTWINIDSQAPNRLGLEGIRSGKIMLPHFSHKITAIQPEKTFGNSRFDLYVTGEGEKAYVECKGVTLEKDRITYFPDAPSVRAEKHVEELIHAKEAGYLAYLLFIIQLGGNLTCLRPNTVLQPTLKEKMLKAKKAGVEILAYSTKIEQAEITIDRELLVDLLT